MADRTPPSPPAASATFLTRASARAAGITAGQLRGPAYIRLFNDLYVSASVEVTPEVRARAALSLAPPGALVARHTAARLLGGVVPHAADIHLTLPSGRVRVAGIDARRGLDAGARIRRIPVTSAEATFVGLADDLTLVDLVVLGDSLVKAGRCLPESLVVAAAGTSRSPAQKTLRRAASLVRAEVDSPMESRLRLLLVLAGLPEPVVNHVEYDDRGHWRRRFDLAYPTHRLAVEYDGRQHAESARQWERDVERREELDSDGWRLVVVLAKGIYREPARTLERVQQAMADVRMPGRVTSEEWKRYFPGPA
jgi:hypothetical protein